MNDRTTAKSNIVGLNVPSVTNAVMNQMLNDNICDNVVFRKDVTGPPLAFGLSNINLDFTGKDRLDITRTGGSLNITVAGIEDGERKFLLITKTPGQGITWVGVIDITPVTAYVSLAAVVLYEIVRKGSLYIANAWLKTIKQATEAYQGILAIATEAQAEAMAVSTKIITPQRLGQALEANVNLKLLWHGYIDRSGEVVNVIKYRGALTVASVSFDSGVFVFSLTGGLGETEYFVNATPRDVNPNLFKRYFCIAGINNEWPSAGQFTVKTARIGGGLDDAYEFNMMIYSFLDV
jgi:hypothetical protein